MSRLRATAPIEVGIGPCECPDTPHEDGDKAWLRPRLTPGAGLEATARLEGFSSDVAEAVKAGKDPDELIPSLTRDLGLIYLRDGLVRWTLLDDAGADVPLSAIDGNALDWDETIRPIAEKASLLYGESVMRPLLGSTSSSRGRTAGSTSATNGSTPKSRKRSGRSTTSTTRPRRKTSKR